MSLKFLLSTNFNARIQVYWDVTRSVRVVSDAFKSLQCLHINYLRNGTKSHHAIPHSPAAPLSDPRTWIKHFKCYWKHSL